MTDNIEPGQEPEMESADLNAILADGQSAPAEEAKAEPAKEPAQQEAAPEAKPETPKQEEPKGPHWYRETLKEKEKRARDAERRAQELERRIQAQEQQRPAPDFNNPQAIYQSFEQRLAEAELKQSIALSARFARREHGAELFEETQEWLSHHPDIELWAQAQDDPWGAAIARFKQERLVAEIGDDPNAYREKLRQELLAELQSQPQGQAPGMTAPRPNIPAPASGQRSAAPRNGPGFAGPTPLTNIIGG